MTAPPTQHLDQATQDHPHARLVLTGMLAAATDPTHALLFHGPAGAGKGEVAREYSALLLAGDATGDEFEQIRGRVLRDTHPDFTWVAPTGANLMRREDIDEPVIRAATRTPMESARRVFVLEAVETMHLAAVNSFLKTLEEPPAYAHFILLTHDYARVLPTIVSRCQTVRFESLSVASLAARLVAKGIDAELARSCASLSRGDAELARWLASPDGEQARTDAGRIVASALRGASGQKRPWQAVVKSAKSAGDAAEERQLAAAEPMLEALPKGRERNAVAKEAEQAAHRAGRTARTHALDRSLNIAASLLRDLAVTAAGAPEQVITTDRRAVIEKNAPGRDAVRLLRAAVEVDAVREKLRVNVSEDLALQALCFRIDELVAGDPRIAI